MKKIIQCNNCGSRIIDRKKAIYCSKKCFNKKTKIFWTIATEKEKLERNKKNFFKYVNKNHNKKCWNWTGYICDGYGRTRYCSKNIRAHRMSWILHNGEIPTGMWVLHKCDNRKCVNPEHLYLGTVLENVSDMIERGRQVITRKYIWSNDEIIKIFEMRSQLVSIKKIATKFAVSEGPIKTILKNERK